MGNFCAKLYTLNVDDLAWAGAGDSCTQLDAMNVYDPTRGRANHTVCIDFAYHKLPDGMVCLVMHMVDEASRFHVA